MLDPLDIQALVRPQVEAVEELRRRVREVELRRGRGWQPIGSGSVSASGEVLIPVPAGYSALKVRLWGSTSSTTGLFAQLNGVTAGGTYEQAWTRYGTAGTPTGDQENTAGQFGVGEWQNRAWACGAKILLFGTGSSVRKSWRAWSWRRNSARQESWGVTADNMAATTEVRVFPAAGDMTANWTLEGFRA